MCHGHPRHHPCAHTSINWHYCPSALIDLETGWETPCGNSTFAPSRPIKSDCPLQNCQFKNKGGSWTCCSCQQGPNTMGWCTMPLSRFQMNPESFSVEAVETTCDHGCCSDCIRSEPSRDSTPNMQFPEMRRGSASRKFGYGGATKSHRRGSGFSLVGGFPPGTGGEAEEGGGSSSTSPSTSPSTSKSSSTGSEYNYELGCPASKTKSSKKRHGKGR